MIFLIELSQDYERAKIKNELNLSFHTAQPLLVQSIIRDGVKVQSGLQINKTKRRTLRFGSGLYTSRVFTNSVQYGKQMQLVDKRYKGKRSQLCFSFIVSGEKIRENHVIYSPEQYRFDDSDMQSYSFKGKTVLVPTRPAHPVEGSFRRDVEENKYARNSDFQVEGLVISSFVSFKVISF